MIIMRYLPALFPLFLLVGCDEAEIVPSDERPVVVSVRRAEHPPRGDTFALAWHFRLAEGWHLYWDGRNDSGAPPSVALDLPAGWSAEPLEWPIPHRLVSPGGILDHVYYDELRLKQVIHWVGDHEADFDARISWVACRDRCVFGDTILHVRDARPPVDGSDIREGPYPLIDLMQAEALDPTWNGSTLYMTWDESDSLAFMPDLDCGPLTDVIRDGAVIGSRITLEFRERDGFFGPARGVLVRIREQRRVAVRIEVPAIEALQTNPGGE
jgi:hypothetical protein